MRRKQNQLSALKSKKAQKLSSRPREPIWRMPPSYKSQVVRNWTIRCDVASNANEQILTTAQLSGLLCVIATGAATSVYMADSWRLKRVDMWSWTPTIGTTVDIMLKYTDNGTAAGQGGPPCTAMDSSASMDVPAFVSLKPPKNSICSLWQDQTTASFNFLAYLCPQQAIMDLHFQMIIDDIDGLVAGPALVAATVGQLYHHPTGTLTPVQPLNRA